MMLPLREFIPICKARFEKHLSLCLHNPSAPALRLKHAMNYGLLNGGKRLRPLLVYATGHIFDAAWENLDIAACAIELIHAYSLIHDDLPAMDNADLRRGKATCHKAYDEATAILAGDALQPLAFEIIATHTASLHPEQRLAMIKILAHACGPNGMVAGQMLDIIGVNTPQELIHMYQLKTAALLAASIKLGAVAAKVSDSMRLTSLDKFAACIGLAFQIQDDLFDIESNTAVLGKPQGLDALNNKITYPILVGIEKTREKIHTLFQDACVSLEQLGKRADLLLEFANYLLQRKK